MKYPHDFEFLSNLVNYEYRSPSASDLSLEPISRLLNALGDPQDGLFVIHVAGTKGKGSVACMLELILRRAGFCTGLYTSPELCRFAERIRVNGEPIPDVDLTNGLARIQSAIRSQVANGGATAPTYFDVTTALAFLYFRLRNVQVAVVEVGMGGRNDSTNVCKPRLCLITSISYDHTRQLGNTLWAIAAEKAGIIKQGCVTVSGVTAAEPQEVIERVSERSKSALWQLGVDCSYSYTPGKVVETVLKPSVVTIKTRTRSWPPLNLKLLGEHQAANATLVVVAVERLRELGLDIGDEAVGRGLAEVRCPARVEMVGQRPLVVVDCAHNVASAEALRKTLSESCPELMSSNKNPGARRSLVFGCSRDKDIAGILGVLTPQFDHVYLTRYRRSARSADKHELLAAASACNCDGISTYYESAAEAWKRAFAESRDQDVICITGSLFLAGELYPIVTV